LDIAGSIAHVTMLAKQKIMTKMEALKIINGLKNIRKDIQEGKFKLDMADEDIHMAIEKELMKRIGEVGGKLHTARSRNDQVVLDTRLFYEWRSKKQFLWLSTCKRHWSKLPRKKSRRLCPDIPICRGRNRSCFRIIFWLSWRCLKGTSRDYRIVLRGWMFCL